MACPFCALGLQHLATVTEIRQQYRIRVLRCHPDKILDPNKKIEATLEVHLLNSAKALAEHYSTRKKMPNWVCSAGAGSGSVTGSCSVAGADGSRYRMGFADAAGSQASSAPTPPLQTATAKPPPPSRPGGIAHAPDPWSPPPDGTAQYSWRAPPPVPQVFCYSHGSPQIPEIDSKCSKIAASAAVAMDARWHRSLRKIYYCSSCWNIFLNNLE
jgi:hypothetical protein